MVPFQIFNQQSPSPIGNRQDPQSTFPQSAIDQMLVAEKED
jgi:hypothetical protein